MKTEYLRIYSEEELHRKMQQTTSLLKRIKEKVKDFHFCDIPALKDMWIQYESTRYIVSESLLLEERYYKNDSISLFIERQVEDDYSDDLQDPDSLHNNLVAMQFLYESIKDFIANNAYQIQPEQYQDPFRLVEDIASDIYLHIKPQETNEYPKVVDILDHLNYIYVYPTSNDFVEMVDVAIEAYNKEQEKGQVYQKLIDTLDLQLDDF